MLRYRIVRQVGNTLKVSSRQVHLEGTLIESCMRAALESNAYHCPCRVSYCEGGSY